MRTRGIMSLAAVAAIVVAACSGVRRQPDTVNSGERRRTIDRGQCERRRQRQRCSQRQCSGQRVRESCSAVGQHADDARAG